MARWLVITGRSDRFAALIQGEIRHDDRMD